MEIELHPLCTLFPRMSGGEFASLASDIKANGLRNPITLLDGMILDGGNRYRACLEAGIDPVFARFEGGNIVSFVLSANLHRRHMSAGQQAAIVASAQDWSKSQTVGGDRKSEDAKIKVQDCTLVTSEQRAAASGASLRTQKDADKVAKASPELAKQVAHGEISLPKAVAQVDNKLPKPKTEEVAQETKPEIPVGSCLIDTDRLDELQANLKEAIDDNASMARVFESDDKLAAALVEAKRYREQARILETRISGLMNEKNEAVRAAKSWQNKFLKLEKQVKDESCKTI